MDTCMLAASLNRVLHPSMVDRHNIPMYYLEIAMVKDQKNKYEKKKNRRKVLLKVKSFSSSDKLFFFFYVL